MATVYVAMEFVFSLGSLICLTAFTVIAMTGALMRERRASAWWLAAASGLTAIVGPTIAPILGSIALESVLFWLVPQVAHLVSTLLLLLAMGSLVDYPLRVPSIQVLAILMVILLCCPNSASTRRD